MIRLSERAQAFLTLAAIIFASLACGGDDPVSPSAALESTHMEMSLTGRAGSVSIDSTGTASGSVTGGIAWAWVQSPDTLQRLRWGVGSVTMLDTLVSKGTRTAKWTIPAPDTNEVILVWAEITGKRKGSVKTVTDTIRIAGPVTAPPPAPEPEPDPVDTTSPLPPDTTTPPPPSPVALAPHLPWTPDQRLELAFASSLPSSGTSVLSPSFGLLTSNTKWWFGDGNGSIATDDMGASNPYVYRHRFPKGASPGSGSGMWVLEPQVGGVTVGYTEWYESLVFELEGTSFEGPGDTGQIKALGYWGVACVNNAIYNQIVGTDGTLTASGNRQATTFSVRIRQQGGGGISLPVSDRGVGTIKVGRAYRFEIYMKLNTTYGTAANGVLRVWITDLASGVQQFREYTTVQYRYETSCAKGYHRRHYDPIWGGMGGGTLSRDQYIRFDHFYIGVRGRT